MAKQKPVIVQCYLCEIWVMKTVMVEKVAMAVDSEQVWVSQEE